VDLLVTHKRDEIIQEAKINFLQTKRLNRKVVRNEIALSWYKCDFNNIDIKKQIIPSKNTINSDLKDSPFQNLLSQINKDHYNLLLINTEGLVIEKIIKSNKFEAIDRIHEVHLGTNAGMIALKENKMYAVYGNEHYLNVLCEYNSYGFPIKLKGELIGIIMIITDDFINDIQVLNIQTQIENYVNLGLSPDTYKPSYYENHATQYSISDALILSESELIKYNILLNQYQATHYPILIYGQKGSGKSTLAYAIAQLNLNKISIYDFKIMPKMVQEDQLNRIWKENGTVIIENLDYLSMELQNKLTMNIEANYVKVGHEDNQVNLIFITDKNIKSESIQYYFSSRLLNRLSVLQVEMKNLHQQNIQFDDILKPLIKRAGIEAYSDEFYNTLKLWTITDELSFSDLIDILSSTRSESTGVIHFNKEDLVFRPRSIVTLEEQEKKYVLRILEEEKGNITKAAKILNISRSTLYRKLEKYK